jgi:hypothetical protein
MPFRRLYQTGGSVEDRCLIDRAAEGLALEECYQVKKTGPEVQK